MAEFTSTVRRARKPRHCEQCYRHWNPREAIQPGDLYRRHVCFPGGEVMSAEHVFSMDQCWSCAANAGRPLIGPLPAGVSP